LEPLSQATKKLLEKKVVSKTTNNMPKRSKLCSEPRYDGPVGQEIDLEYQRRENTNDGKWSWSPQDMKEKQPAGRGAKYIQVQGLGIMPVDVLQPLDKVRKVKAKTTKTIPTVMSSEYRYNTDGKQPLEWPQ
jgi:hypothetical protein